MLDKGDKLIFELRLIYLHVLPSGYTYIHTYYVHKYVYMYV